MKIEHHEELFPYLKGKVFHVTPSVNMQAIRDAGALFPNHHLNQPSRFGNTENGFFRLRGCVSFFDYRGFGTLEWKEHAYKCLPTMFLKRNNPITILFLCESQFHKLESWKVWKEGAAWHQRVVPYVETGYKGRVSLEFIIEELGVESDNNYQV